MFIHARACLPTSVCRAHHRVCILILLPIRFAACGPRRGLYVPGNLWLTREEILGRAKAFLPYVGFITIKLTEYPLLKYAIVGIMGIFVLSSNE